LAVSDVGSRTSKALTSGIAWVALQAIGTIGGIYFVYRWIAGSGGGDVRSEEKKRARSILARTLLRHPGDWEMVGTHAAGVLDDFEGLGLMVKRRIVSAHSVWRSSYDDVVHWWQALAGYVLWTRENGDDSSCFIEFEYLYKAMIRQERKQRRRKMEPIDARSLRDFLQDEVHVEVREFRRGDLGAIVAIETKSFTREAYATETFERLARDHGDGFLVATIFGQVVGYAAGYVNGAIGEIDSMAIDPEFRGLGIARKLVKMLCALLEDQGAEGIRLEVRVTNDGAIRLYEELGFAIAERIEDFYGPGEHAYRMIGAFTMKRSGRSR
jgi:ribosomal-protein-alanine N-acetyltransferase